jgi:hypothetical protein
MGYYTYDESLHLFDHEASASVALHDGTGTVGLRPHIFLPPSPPSKAGADYRQPPGRSPIGVCRDFPAAAAVRTRRWDDCAGVLATATTPGQQSRVEAATGAVWVKEIAAPSGLRVVVLGRPRRVRGQVVVGPTGTVTCSSFEQAQLGVLAAIPSRTSLVVSACILMTSVIFTGLGFWLSLCPAGVSSCGPRQSLAMLVTVALPTVSFLTSAWLVMALYLRWTLLQATSVKTVADLMQMPRLPRWVLLSGTLFVDADGWSPAPLSGIPHAWYRLEVTEWRRRTGFWSDVV